MATTITGRIVLQEAQDTGYKMWLGRLLNKLVREHIMPYLDVEFETDAEYAPLDHDHDAEYAPLGHDHDTEYAPLGHDHDDRYVQLEPEGS
jgi:hypothetical protein